VEAELSASVDLAEREPAHLEQAMVRYAEALLAMERALDGAAADAATRDRVRRLLDEYPFPDALNAKIERQAGLMRTAVAERGNRGPADWVSSLFDRPQIEPHCGGNGEKHVPPTPEEIERNRKEDKARARQARRGREIREAVDDAFRAHRELFDAAATEKLFDDGAARIADVAKTCGDDAERCARKIVAAADAPAARLRKDLGAGRTLMDDPERAGKRITKKMRRAFLATDNPFGRRAAAKALNDLGRRAAQAAEAALRLRREQRLVRMRIEASLRP
jgi:hypothetical protein